ncbi:aminodeoxychorismate synthase component I [Tessaracoccus oleiagri]|uniref:aminodeoxychorismate synthase n=1 Tax=Tessaracoccus oleiagri TaxID=686624 RepID=A0A1G9KQ25_9ACTN|nr:aminodeoxychorismate synthase component I [Tessaracoccus oleiagri]SDL51395.1 para-aminobenzoate synthetase [Tessaracoccus oleiagri]
MEHASTVGPLAAMWRVLDLDLDVEATAHGLLRDADASFWLDSASVATGNGRHSIIGTDRGSLAEVVRYRLADGHVRLRAGGRDRTVPADVLTHLQRQLATPVVGDLPDLPFRGGYVGYLGYECKALTVAPGRHTAETPDAYWLRPQSFLVHDHATGRTHLAALHPHGGDTGEAAALLDALEAALVERTPGTEAVPEDFGEAPGRWRLPAREYESRVRRAQAALRRGDSYEICLTDTFVADAHPGGWELYRILRRLNPAPYAAHLRFRTFGDSLDVLSASPERFLRVDRDRTVESRPIKGTAPRAAHPAEDRRLAADLGADPKTRAENLIIVDLLRNDLGRVCRPGTVHVPELMQVESYATVHQLVSTVRGQLRADKDLVDLLRACFPGGSMTGAPKPRTLELIDELEAGPRGIYSGTLGHLGFDGSADLAIVIRTLVGDGRRWTLGAGGAVVLDSDPDAENAEKELKARALRRALRSATGP